MGIHTPNFIRIGVIGLPKTCAIFALLNYRLHNVSPTCMASPTVHTLLTATWHTHDALKLWYGLQFMNQDIDKVLYILWIMRPLSNAAGKNVPDNVRLS